MQEFLWRLSRSPAFYTPRVIRHSFIAGLDVAMGSLPTWPCVTVDALADLTKMVVRSCDSDVVLLRTGPF